MSLKYRNANGVETPVAGLNGTSGELVPSVSLYQSGSQAFSCDANSWTTVDVVLNTPMPDNDYQVILDSGASAYVHVQNVMRKSTTGFIVIVYNRDALSSGEGILNWQAFKLMTDESRALDEAAIAALQENALQYTLLGSGDDIDTLIQPGNYGGYNGDGLGGTFPYVGNSQFSLLVTKAREYRYQLLQAGERLYQRYVGVSGSTIGTWSSWSEYSTGRTKVNTSVTIASPSSANVYGELTTYTIPAGKYFTLNFTLWNNYNNWSGLKVIGGSSAQGAFCAVTGITEVDSSETGHLGVTVSGCNTSASDMTLAVYGKFTDGSASSSNLVCIYGEIY